MRSEEIIKEVYVRIEKLEAKLSSDKLDDNKKKLLQTEIKEMRKLLQDHENQLSHLRTHNTKTFAFTVILLFTCFFLYMLYILINGKDF